MVLGRRTVHARAGHRSSRRTDDVGCSPSIWAATRYGHWRTLWRNAGMAESDTRSVAVRRRPRRSGRQPGDYLSRPGFWFGAIGVAACWLGGAQAVAAPLYRACGRTGARRRAPCSLTWARSTPPSQQPTPHSTAAAATSTQTRTIDPGWRSSRPDACRAIAEKAVDETLGPDRSCTGPGATCASTNEHAERGRRSDRVRQTEPRRARPCRARFTRVARSSVR